MPDFQRPLRWRAQDVIDLLDSIYSGYPVGVLLLARRDDEPAARVTFGSVVVDAPAMRESYFLVDGQQRVTALVAALHHPDARPRSGVFAVWFDLEARRFRRPVSGAAIPDTWVPCNAMRDSKTLLSWIEQWPLNKERPELKDVAFGLPDALLNYPIPAYYFEGTSPDALRLIFKRVNTTGVRMQEEEVFNALFTHEGPKPLRAAVIRLHEATGFGMLTERLLHRCLQCVLGVDPKDSEELERGEVPSDAVQRTETALRKVIGFLQEDVGFAHASVTPYPSPVLIALARYFDHFPRPSPRSRLLLRWWVWRGALSKQHSSSSQGYIGRLRRLIKGGDDDVVAQAILRDAPDRVSLPTASLPWNPKNAEVRICMAALLAHASLPDSAQLPIDGFDEDTIATHDESASDWLFLGPDRKRPRVVADALVQGDPDTIDPTNADAGWLDAQLIPPAAVAALRAGDLDSFRRHRAEALDAWIVRYLIERHGLGESGRVSIGAILRAAEDAHS